eukprot:CAMPEP_0115678554 /NCGR_PEP_ID=MMETSP0272-20121206/55818_1 /TAXON_ID=71861 /ORGANISM="Scrippsiella trochoidea, Strain CCMP3099" /LENGTH=52 /DNA_ID=CAMNT_0003117741 /DNA_START=49 /DNA_END=204 /DNA_ORIENTATION=+
MPTIPAPAMRNADSTKAGASRSKDAFSQSYMDLQPMCQVLRLLPWLDTFAVP